MYDLISGVNLLYMYSSAILVSMKHPRTGARNGLIVKGYMAGATAPALALEFGLSTARIYQIVSRSCPVSRTDRRPPARERAIRSLYNGRWWSVAELVAAFDLPECEINRILREK